MFDWPASASGCYVKTVKLCSDEPCANLITSGPVSFQTNPSQHDSSTYVNSPELIVQKSAPLDELIYVQVNSQTTGAYKTSKIKVVICGLETLQASTYEYLIIPSDSADQWITLKP